MLDLPIQNYDASEEELIRLSHYNLILNEGETAYVETPVFLENLGKKGRRKVAKRMKRFLYKKILNGSATPKQISIYKLL